MGTSRFLDLISAGPEQTQPPFAGAAIGTSWMTPETAAFRATRKKYGSLDDPDAGGYQLSQIHWDKEGCEVSNMDATYGGWYGS